MRFRSYFLISPSTELARQVEKLPKEEAGGLMEPLVWSGVEHDRGDPKQFEDVVKILFLETVVRLHSSYSWFSSVFDGFSATERFFESKWSVERLTFDVSVEEALDEVIANGRGDSLVAEQGGSPMGEVLAAKLKWRVANPGPVEGV